LINGGGKAAEMWNDRKNVEIETRGWHHLEPSNSHVHTPVLSSRHEGFFPSTFSQIQLESVAEYVHWIEMAPEEKEKFSREKRREDRSIDARNLGQPKF